MSIAVYDESKVLLKRISEGDRTAFMQFYSSHLNRLYRYIYLFTKSKEDTEDILQEILIRIWENREKLPEIESPASYLTKIAKNKILDKVRSLQIRQRVLTEIRRSRNASETTTGDDYAYREYYQVVQQAIDKLPPKRKIIFRLNIENGLSQDEIARQLNISRSVVQKQLYSAIHFVRKYLFDHGEISLSLLFTLF